MIAKKTIDMKIWSWLRVHACQTTRHGGVC